MKPTIRNKLLLGFGGMLLLMVTVSGIGTYSVFRLRHSARETTQIGDRLNAIAIEIQVHNLEAQRKAKSYFLERGTMGEQVARETYLDEAQFEIHEIQSLAAKAVKLSPTEQTRAKFARMDGAVQNYVTALNAAVKAAQQNATSKAAKDTLATYEETAERLHETAEDGEIAGRDVAQTFQEEIEWTSKRAVGMVVGFSIAGFLVALTFSLGLSRAILVPVFHLREVAENISMGNLDTSVRRYSNDEIGDLADSFSRMVTAVKFFRMESESAEAELAAGAEKHS